MMAQIRSYQAKLAIAKPAEVKSVGQSESVSFSQAVRSMVQNVNDSQIVAKNQRTAFEKGDDIPLTDVVLSMQKSSLSFEATLQVRNKVLKAYEEIMNMPVLLVFSRMLIAPLSFYMEKIVRL